MATFFPLQWEELSPFASDIVDGLNEEGNEVLGR